MKKEFSILKRTHLYSTSELRTEVEAYLNMLSADGWEIVSVSFGFSGLFMPAAFITMCREKPE